MKAKNQPISSEMEAKERLIVYVYDYLNASNAKGAAKLFLEEINYTNNIQINQDGPGFLVDWWCVFWDLYAAASEKRSQSEPSSEARVFHDYNMRSVMSPSCTRTSPPQQGPPFIGGRAMMPDTRYGPHSVPLRGGPPVNVGPRMQGGMGGGGQGMPPQMGVVPHGPPHGPPMMGAASPRYAPHPGHMTPGSSASSGPMGPEPGPSPGINRMTPNHSGSPHPQVVGPSNGMGGPMVGPPGGPHGGPPQMGPQGGPVQGMQQRGPPQGWQNNFNVNSPADPQQCFLLGPPVSQGQQAEFGGMMMSDGGMMDVKSANNSGPPNQQQDEYVMSYGQQGDQGEAGPEIMKLKESLENNTKEYNDNDQTGFSSDYGFS